MADKTTLLCFVFGLIQQTMRGVSGQCAAGVPINIAAYEGATNLLMTCNSPTKVSWTAKPASDGLGNNVITNYDEVVAPAYTNLYSVSPSGLNIKTAQGLATIPPISTAGLYVIQINGSTTKFGAKVVVVREPPSCNCVANSTKIQINCSLTYADVNFNSINAKMTWTTGDGTFLKNDTPSGSGRTLKNGYYTSVSTIYVDAYNPTNYQCMTTFSQPTSIYFAFVATNAPAFSASCTPSYCGYTTSQTPTTVTDLLTSGAPSINTDSPTTTASVHPLTTTTTTPTTTTPTPTTTTNTNSTTTTTPPTTTPQTPTTTTTTNSTTTTTPPTTTPQTPTTTTTTTSTTTTTPPTTAHTPTTTECNCSQTTSCLSQDDSCTKDSECQPPDGISLTHISDECVVKAELYARCGKCCPDNFICGVVVTLRNDSRWLIYDSICDDNKCEMVVVNASCMSSSWKLLTERKIAISGVGDYVEVGNGVQMGLNATDCSDSCKRMMNLP